MKRLMILMLVALLLVALDPTEGVCADSNSVFMPDDVMFGATWNGETNMYSVGTSFRFSLGGPMFAIAGVTSLYTNSTATGVGFYIFDRSNFTIGLFGGPGLAIMSASKDDPDHQTISYVEGQTGLFAAWRPSDDWPGIAGQYIYNDPIKANAHVAGHSAFLGFWVPIE